MDTTGLHVWLTMGYWDYGNYGGTGGYAYIGNELNWFDTTA